MKPKFEPESTWAEKAIQMTNAEIVNHLGIAEALLVLWIPPEELFNPGVSATKVISAASVLHTIREVVKLLPKEFNK